MADKDDCDHCSCTATPTNNSVHQTLSEMEWERGIWYAALNGDEDRVNSIIRKCRDPEVAVNELDNFGYTALHYAARNGHVSICRLLLENGAKINAQTRNGKATPLHKAAVGGKIGAVKLLIQQGAGTEMQDDDGQTALHKAVGGKHPEVIRLLTEACPQLVTIKDKKGNVALLVHPSPYIND